ncbi:MAG: DUF839 domain-containing protein [Acidobacteria bacterium]|nr:DUF839 domain-containing protein [Acidobacteriota bacterium]
MKKNTQVFLSGDVGFEGTEPRRDCSDTFYEVMERRINRRSLLKGAAALAPLFVVGGAATGPAAEKANAQASNPLGFTPVSKSTGDEVTVPEGYFTYPLLKWGEPLEAGAPAFDPDNLTAEAQSMQVGYNCDNLQWFDLPFGGLLCVNHEYTNAELMFPTYPTLGADETAVEIEAHGVSVAHVRPLRTSEGIKWQLVQGSPLNRAIRGNDKFEISGPAAGHPLLRTSYDPTGKSTQGTFNNCGGGKTPYNTFLTCEENFDQYFANADGQTNELAFQSLRRFGMAASGGSRQWAEFVDRFDVRKEPNEPNCFGWVVEIDPYDPTSTPVKRTALGRFKHEASSTTTSKAGQVVVYSGDDARFEYVYKFVSEKPVDRKKRENNFGILDSGTLYVARFNDDGTGDWLRLVAGEGPLTAVNGFPTQAEVLMFARQAADLLGATQMDRPEDIDINPTNGYAYVALTNNTRRTADQVDAANPRPSNSLGHIIEIREVAGDAASETFNWDIFMLCGDPSSASAQTPEGRTFFAGYDETEVSSIANPDNLAFGRDSVLWIATDGQPGTSVGGNDAVYACPTEGPERGHNQQFLSSVRGCEVASLVFNTQQNALFVSIQHPGEGGTLNTDIVSNFPDGVQPPRPTVMAIGKKGGTGRIGS